MSIHEKDSSRSTRSRLSFQISEKLGSGAFGDIYQARDIDTDEAYAVKLEKKKGQSTLQHEHAIYKILWIPEIQFIPQVYRMTTFPVDGEPVKGMVMDLLGPSLQQLFEKCGKKFTLKTVLMLGKEILAIIEYVHFRNFLHRDIKPENFVIGLGKNAPNIYLIDFGLAKLYRNPISLKHNALAVGRSLTGTARFASLNAHKGYEHGRRDDLESLLYMLVYFYKGSLPWQGLPAKTKQEKYEHIKLMKQKISPEQLTEGLPLCFFRFFEHVKQLEYEEMPSYLYLRHLFVSAMKSNEYEDDKKYDWVIRGENP